MAADPGDERSIGLTLAAEILDSARFVLGDVDTYGRGYVVLVREPGGRIGSGIADAASVIDSSDEYPTGPELRAEIDTLRHYTDRAERELAELGSASHIRAWWVIRKLRQYADETEAEAIQRGDLPARQHTSQGRRDG